MILSGKYQKLTVLVCYGCLGKVPQMKLSQHNRNLLSHDSGGQKSEIKVSVEPWLCYIRWQKGDCVGWLILITAAAAAKALQSCPTLCDPIDGSPPGSPVPGILQARTGVGCHFLLQCMKVKSESEVAQSCSTLSDPMDCSLPGSSVHGIFQARVLEWGAITFSEESSR